MWWKIGLAIVVILFTAIAFFAHCLGRASGEDDDATEEYFRSKTD